MTYLENENYRVFLLKSKQIILNPERWCRCPNGFSHIVPESVRAKCEQFSLDGAFEFIRWTEMFWNTKGFAERAFQAIKDHFPNQDISTQAGTLEVLNKLIEMAGAGPNMWTYRLRLKPVDDKNLFAATEGLARRYIIDHLERFIELELTPIQ